MVHIATGQYDQAIDAFSLSLSIISGLHGEDHPDTASCYANVGTTYFDSGDLDQAIDYHGRAYAIRMACLGIFLVLGWIRTMVF